MSQTASEKAMPIGAVSQSGPRPKPFAAQANMSPVAIAKPKGFRSAICARSPPMIQSIGATRSAARAGKPPRSAEATWPSASSASPAATR